MHHDEEILDYIIPTLEMQFENEEIAYNFYNEYARSIGFGIRKEYRNLSKKDGVLFGYLQVLTSRKFSCHKEGQRPVDKRDYHTKDGRAETRTGCQAQMTIALDRNVGKYKVSSFFAEHNHPLQPPSYVHMIRSHRRITESQGDEIQRANECGLSLKDFNEFMTTKAGGRENLEFIKLDQKNYLRHTFRFGEVSALLTYFKNQARKDPSFFYEFQMDADTEMINDYGYFGDVVVFDTTYRTNKYYRPFGVFVGYNNHRETVIFGAALLYDETIPSFEWLFETFLKAMGGKKPKTILTDQDAAMANAIPSVMPENFHDFSRNFEACIDVYEKEEDFLRAWDALLTKHEVSSKSWLHTIFKVKEKWAWAYVNETFTAGMRSTQLSESLNSVLKKHLKSDLNLVDFFNHFERIVNSKRYNESIAEHDSIHKLPRLKMKKAPMLVQAGDTYTPKIFEEFQEDYEEHLGAIVTDHKEDQLMHLYTIANVNTNKERTVASNPLTQSVYCECRKYETHGILCSHALKVLDIMNIKLIPDHYILKRWTRVARRGSKNDWNGQRHKQLDMKAHFTNRYRKLCPRIGTLVTRACESHETYTFMSKVCEESAKIIKQMLAKKQSTGIEAQESCHISISMTSVEPERLIDSIDYNGPKGIKKRPCPYKERSRPKSWLEKS
ncbi:hypothetical protein RND81_08G027500 [Saponaria officinalis]|uniref:Protein FAR1-RELATED SEQUENCE n=1 Tax=Saponaria officinalis TaxID=3572 RepID=A0AAW1J376_SAPOF